MRVHSDALRVNHVARYFVVAGNIGGDGECVCVCV